MDLIHIVSLYLLTDIRLQEKLLRCLQDFQTSFNEGISELRDRQTVTEENIDQLRLELLSTNLMYNTSIEYVKKLENEIKKNAISNNEIPYVFHAPKENPWFGGRSSELEKLGDILRPYDVGETKVTIAAVCGLGGVGKTSLATEYAQRKKNYYTGGVYWFSGEDDNTFEDSVFDVAARFGTQKNSFKPTFSATLAVISRNKNPWLIVLDNMDELNMSANIIKLVSGTWQHGASGHLLITTRRNPSTLANEIRGFDERCCLSLECFGMAEGKTFLFKRTGISRDNKVDIVAEKLIQQLGGLPLALEQAGAYIKTLPCTLSQYLEEYDSQRLRLLDCQNKAVPVSEYDKPDSERLAVLTTWLLNFDHINRTVDGKAAIRFLYASAFLNPKEIQKDIINVGQPPVTDEEFNKCVRMTLGCQRILKLLTDFSLFKETRYSNLSVHHLVQEVIHENLSQEEEIQSIIDAIRMLHYAFINCSSPDELLSGASNEREKRPSMVSSGNLSRFYKWHKLCSHTYELVGHLKRVIKKSYADTGKAFQLETARIVYECAIHLSANLKHDKAKEVANFAKDLFNVSNQKVPASSVFPHTIPLPELVRRHIQYSCNTPATSKDGECSDNVETPFDSISSEQLEEMRIKGNNLFKKGDYVNALKIYSDAIEQSKNSQRLFDVRLLSNRASVCLKLKRYDEALQDAEEYITKCPKCWKGYARKALALVELKDMHGAFIAASLAYYYEKNIFRNFPPFKANFDSSLVERLFLCGTNSDLLEALRKACTWNVSSDAPEDLPIIILKPRNYLLSLARTVGDFGVLPIENCILVGSEANCSVTFGDNYRVRITKSFMAYHVSFHSCSTDVYLQSDSVVKFIQCSFKSSNYTNTSFCCEGKLKVDSCIFNNCTKGGLTVVGDAEIENSEFCGNGAGGLEVRDSGRLIVRKSKIYANKQGLLIGPKVKKCVVQDCEIYDNEFGGVVATDCASCVTIRGNCIYDNESGVVVMRKSNVSILDNKIQRNKGWGISIEIFSQAVVKNNKVDSNQCGGICVGAMCEADSYAIAKSVTKCNDTAYNFGPGICDEKQISKCTGSTFQSDKGKSVIECNDITDNFGPGICDEKQLSERRANTFQNNRDDRNQSTAESETKFCYYCKKPEKELKKCSKCLTAQYCGEQCQENDWQNHKMICNRLLSEGSVVLNYVLQPRSKRGRGLLPVGPKHSAPPRKKTKFIVKMSAGVANEEGKRYDPSVVELYDRSLTIDGILTEANQIYNLVWQYGTRDQLNDNWKNLFMWVKGPNNGTLRVFTNEFPSYQSW